MPSSSTALTAPAIKHCGLTVIALPPDPRFRMVLRRGRCHRDAARRDLIALAPNRVGTKWRRRSTLTAICGDAPRITAPGTVEGGDVCEADGHYLIGLSARTNMVGAEQLAGLLGDLGYSSTVVDIRSARHLLHLKTGITYLGDGRMILTSDFPRSALASYELIEVPESERYAANCVRVNEFVLVAAGDPSVAEAISDCGYEILELEMSEFRKLDGGLSCLSLRI